MAATLPYLDKVSCKQCSPPNFVSAEKADCKQGRLDCCNKVKEIKQRQQNWFQQRERSIADVRKSNSGTESPIATTNQFGSQSSAIHKKIPNVGKTQVLSETNSYEDAANNAGFERWLSARQNKSQNFIKRQNESENFIKRQNKDYDMREYMTPTEDERLSENYESAAERIASRVKREVAAEQWGRSGTADKMEEGLESHKCQLCNKVMVAPKYSPILVIPCGHTYCVRCAAEQKKCPGCKCPVQSLTYNITLQQIITEFVRKNTQAAPVTKPARDYEAECDQLSMRFEVLQSEADNIHIRMRELDDQVSERHQQMQGMDRQMERLEESMRLLRAQRRDLQDQVDKIQGQKQEEVDKLDMVKSTIAQLSQDMLKAKSMADMVQQRIT